jgi:hypothetical protein
MSGSAFGKPAAATSGHALMERTRAIITSLLADRSGAAEKALYQHGFPHSLKWGYLPDRDSPIIPFDEADIQQLCRDGVLQFSIDGDGRSCLVLGERLRTQSRDREATAAAAAPAPAATTMHAPLPSADRPQPQQIARVFVGGGATFGELVVARRAGGGSAYHFDALVSLSPEDAQPAPPLVFIHIPKTAGTTVNNLLMKNFRYRLDAYGANFFPRYYPEEFVSLVGAPLADDTRRPVFFTGHIDVDNDVFRYMPVAYVAITVLRDPVQRIVSHYRGESALPDSPVSGDIRSGKLTIMDFFRRLYPPYQLQHQIFAPKSHSVEESLRNLENKVSLFGLNERLDEFVVLLSELLGLPNLVQMPVNRTEADAPEVTRSHIEELRGLLADEVAFYELAAALYDRRTEKLGRGLGSHVDQLRQANRDYSVRRQKRLHAWTRFYG